jgi:hypothetical protein
MASEEQTELETLSVLPKKAEQSNDCTGQQIASMVDQELKKRCELIVYRRYDLGNQTGELDESRNRIEPLAINEL